MSLEFAVLASGSKGNCIYVGDGCTRILVDCGLSALQVERRLAAVGVSAREISAIVVTHEHRDHTVGLPVFARKHAPLVWANRGAREMSQEIGSVARERLCEFATGVPFSVEGLSFEPFSVSHDAADPVGFRISGGGSCLVLATDLGRVTALVRERLRGAHALLLESNHDPELLEIGPYSWALKQRIRGSRGHLSNEQAASALEDVCNLDGSLLRYVVAMHISEKCNRPELAVSALRRAWRTEAGDSGPQFIAASAAVPTQLFRL